jgi:hypothetical protein
MTPRVREIIKTVASERGVPVLSIVSHCRIGKVYRARMEVAKRLDACGYGSSQIGRLLHHDHTTILFYLGRIQKRPAQEKWRAPRVRHLNCFCHRCYFPVAPPPKPAKPRKLYLTPYAGADDDYVWKERAA